MVNTNATGRQRCKVEHLVPGVGYLRRDKWFGSARQQHADGRKNRQQQVEKSAGGYDGDAVFLVGGENDVHPSAHRHV
jgi:hypothetical protein